jgi:hypothetical protein
VTVWDRTGHGTDFEVRAETIPGVRLAFPSIISGHLSPGEERELACGEICLDGDADGTCDPTVCRFDVTGDGSPELNLVDGDGDGFCDFPRFKTHLHGNLVFDGSTSVEFTGTTIVEADTIIVERGAELRGTPDTLRQLTLYATDGDLRSDGSVVLGTGDDLTVRGRGALRLTRSTRLSAKDRLLLEARNGDLALAPRTADPTGLTAFAGNDLTLNARGARGGLLVRNAQVGGRRITLDNTSNVMKRAGHLEVDAAVLTTDPVETGIPGTPYPLALRGSAGIDDLAPLAAIVIRNGTRISTGQNIVASTRLAADATCVGAGVVLDAAHGARYIDFTNARGPVLVDPTATLIGRLRGTVDVVPDACE